MGLAKIYKRMEEYHKAIENYTKAINLDPKEAEAYCDRSFIYDEIGENSKIFSRF